MTSSQIYDAILLLKEHIGDVLPSCKVILSSAPVLRFDNGKAGLILKNIITKMKGINNVIFNASIDGSCLDGKGSEPKRVESVSY